MRETVKLAPSLHRARRRKITRKARKSGSKSMDVMERLVLKRVAVGPQLTMTILVKSIPPSEYAVNVRCVQVIQPSTQPNFSDIVETAQRRIMLAQLVTDEAKPGSGEKWFRTYTEKLR